LAIARRPGRWGALRAARLLATAEALHEDMPVPLHRQKEIDEIQTEIRTHLDEDALEAARIKGRAMSADRAAWYAYALATRWGGRERSH
jgi:hypothetical protein